MSGAVILAPWWKTLRSSSGFNESLPLIDVVACLLSAWLSMPVFDVGSFEDVAWCIVATFRSPVEMRCLTGTCCWGWSARKFDWKMLFCVSKRSQLSFWLPIFRLNIDSEHTFGNRHFSNIALCWSALEILLTKIYLIRNKYLVNHSPKDDQYCQRLWSCPRSKMHALSSLWWKPFGYKYCK